MSAEMAEEKPRSRVDKIKGEFYRKGRCAVCGKSVERSKTFSASTMDALNAMGDEWGKLPLKHARCE